MQSNEIAPPTLVKVDAPIVAKKRESPICGRTWMNVFTEKSRMQAYLKVFGGSYRTALFSIDIACGVGRPKFNDWS